MKVLVVAVTLLALSCQILAAPTENDSEEVPPVEEIPDEIAVPSWEHQFPVNHEDHAPRNQRTFGWLNCSYRCSDSCWRQGYWWGYCSFNQNQNGGCVCGPPRNPSNVPVVQG